MALSTPFIRRPIGTGLIGLGVLLLGLVTYRALPVASMPTIDLPTLRVSASRPGADPAVMAATVAAPLERRLGEIAGVTEITSTSSLGSASVIVQFDLSRNIDKAARDVQSAINAAASDLPSDLPALPTLRKFNPSAAPVLILALTSDTLGGSVLYDVADSVLAQRIAQVEGVADVTVAGAEQPAVRIRFDPGKLATMGLSLEAVRLAVVNATVTAPVGALQGDETTLMLSVNDQITKPEDFRNILIRMNNGNTVRLGDIADVQPSVRNVRSAGWLNTKPSVSLTITRAAGANVIETVDRVLHLVPELQRWIPAGVEISVVNDRSSGIRATMAELDKTLLLSGALVMVVVFVFLRRVGPTFAAGLAVPLSLAGTFPLMLVSHFSIDIVSLLAIIVAVGFVVDDAIVMIENIDRYERMGLSPKEAAEKGAGQIGFTVVSITLSLIAAFLPLLFMPGIVGKVFGEFAWTMVFAIGVSAFVSLTMTPAVMGLLPHRPDPPPGLVDKALAALVRGYTASLKPVMRYPGLVASSLLVTIALSAFLFTKVPKGYLPQDDTGLLIGFTEANADISYQAMYDLQLRVNQTILADPAVQAATFSLGTSGWGGGNAGRMFISLKPVAERGDVRQVMARLRGKLGQIPGIRTFMFPAQDIRAGGRQSRSQYQFTLWSSDLDLLQATVPKVVERMQAIPGLVDVTTDQDKGGLQTRATIDREAASRLGVSISAIDAALSNAYSQRQIATLYGPRNQYRVILEADPRYAQGPQDLSRVFVPGRGTAMVPLSALVKMETVLSPLSINHQGPFPAVTVTYDIAVGTTLDEASRAIRQAVDDMRLPSEIRADFAGDAKDFQSSSNRQVLLIIAALLVIYIVLGVLYESLVHPLTILSTLPSAGLGALLTLWITGTELSVMAMIGIILLIGIVKKNGIMMVDFALETLRETKCSPEEAVMEACRERFRPILMTTLTAMLGAVPMAFGTGAGAALRAPLGLTIIGGLIASQLLTLYTTPALYLVLERLSQRVRGVKAEPLPHPAE